MEKEITLVVAIKKNVFVHKFDTITEAYRYYLKKYSTLGDWWYYLTCAHKLLSSVTNEEIMECIFRNCFTNACITESYERRQRKAKIIKFPLTT